MPALLLALLTTLSQLPLGEGLSEGAEAPPHVLTSVELEAQATAHTQSTYRQKGRDVPQSDAALARAARTLAAHALKEGTEGPLEHAAMTEAISAAGAADPVPHFIIIRAWSRAHVLEELQAHRALARTPASHVGAGAAVEGIRAVLVLLLVDRLATLAPFPRSLDAPGTRLLCSEHAPRMGVARVFVTLPNGQVVHSDTSQGSGASSCTELTFPAPGRYTVELVLERGRGPEVASLFLVDVGTSTDARAAPGTSSAMPAPGAESTTVEDAQRVLLDRINALRRAYGRTPLALDQRLNRVAQAYSERMAREHFFAHVSPDGVSVRGRLAAEGQGAQLFGENIARAAGPLEAHLSLERSPGHRANLLGLGFTHVGIGAAFREEDGRREVLVTEVFTGASP
ncbi:MAG: CAP domain-containing protein [Myxococcaceae bacterium]|nr:CAP domain-containing protein [Myxococcaceae bacterium]MCI0668985.1 CAP domain-containing protein [Myxococcaceae bacterium]